MTIREVVGSELVGIDEAGPETDARIAACAASCALRAITSGMDRAGLFDLQKNGGAHHNIATGQTLIPCPSDGCPGDATALLAGGPPIIYEHPLVPQSEV